MTTDPLSDAARRVLRINPTRANTDLLPRQPGATEAIDVLHALSPADVLARPPRDTDMAAAVLAGLWLWHDDLGQAHEICQDLNTPVGGWWHAIVHRREGDFGNAKYWYARVGRHPLLEPLGIQAAGTVAHAPADKALLKLSLGPWNGAAFVDLVQQVHESPSDERHSVAVALQQLEWRVLFDHCTREAAGQ